MLQCYTPGQISCFKFQTFKYLHFVLKSWIHKLDRNPACFIYCSVSSVWQRKLLCKPFRAAIRSSAENVSSRRSKWRSRSAVFHWGASYVAHQFLKSGRRPHTANPRNLVKHHTLPDSLVEPNPKNRLHEESDSWRKRMASQDPMQWIFAVNHG